jgi:hypothetical protein
VAYQVGARLAELRQHYTGDAVNTEVDDMDIVEGGVVTPLVLGRSKRQRETRNEILKMDCQDGKGTCQVLTPKDSVTGWNGTIFQN